MNLSHDGGAFPHRRRNTLGRARPHVADREHAGAGGLKRQERAGTWTDRVAASRPCDHEPFLVHRDASVEPGRIRIGANEEEEVSQGAAVRFSGRPVAK